jgi:hypothetical protein
VERQVKIRLPLWGMFGLLSASACLGPNTRTAAAERPDALEPQWQDALPPAPKLLVFLRPKELRADKVYGPMLRRALELAREQRVTSGALVLDAIEDAEEVIAELGDLTAPETSTPAGSQELLLVLRGARSDIDPARLVGSEGDLLWSDGPNGGVRELVHERDRDGTPNPTSLFELPNRTWVVASGAARDRARDAFAHPARRPEPSLAIDSLATVSIDGPSLAARVSLLQSAGPLAGVGHGLRSVDLELLAPDPPGEATLRPADSFPPRQVRAVASYADGEAAAVAGGAMRVMLQVVSRLKPTGLAWLGAGQVDVAGSRVIVTGPVPMDLLRSILYAGHAADTSR